MSVGCYIYHRWDILGPLFKGVRGGLAFNPPPPPPLYTPMQLCHMMDYNESGAWRHGVGRNGEEVQIVGWGLEYPEKA